MTLGIEIGGTKLQIVVGNKAGQIAERFRFTVDRDAGAAGILAHIDDTLDQLPEKPTAIGVGFGGPVDWRAGRIITSHHVAGWDNYCLSQHLRKKTDASTIRVENDANVAALGEARQGAGRGFRHVFYVTLGSGVGGGMVVDGQLYHGALPGEAELGHMRMSRAGDTLEDHCAGWAVDRRIREHLPHAPDHQPLKRLIGEATAHESKFLKAALEEGDPLAEAIVQEWAEYCALGLSHVTHLFHPELIILGGGLSLVGEPLRSAVEKALPPLLLDAFKPAPQLKLAELGEDVVPIGALALLSSFS